MSGGAWLAHCTENFARPRGNTTFGQRVRWRAKLHEWLTGSSIGTGFTGIDPEEERDPPPEPTSFSFPPEVYLEHAYWSEENLPPNLQSLFSRIIRPTDIRDEHAVALNINVLAACPIEDLVPLAPDGTSYLPSLEDDGSPDTTSYSNAARSDPAVRRRKDFKERITELQVENDVAFRTINRTVKGGARPPRLAYLRKFWEGLDVMSRYWDCSLDEYYTLKEEEYDDEREQSAKRQRVDSHPPTPDSTTATPGASPPASPQLENDHPSRDSDAIANEGEANNVDPSDIPLPPEAIPLTSAALQTASSAVATPSARPRIRYKGRRISTGSEMPDNVRADTIQGFVEAAVWPFRASFNPPRVMPRVHFGKLILPVRQTAAVYRVPDDKKAGRAGWIEGPILGIQTRPETDFVKNGPEEKMDAIRLDMLREVGALLQLAQERRREGRVEALPGKGKWWTETPRWGGGPGGEVGDANASSEISNTDVLEAAEELLDAAKLPVGKARREKQKKTPEMMWKELKCGKGYWDHKTKYVAIGKEGGSAYDEVFHVSSLNFHVSIVKMTVHTAYLDYLESATLPNPLPDDAEWCRPTMQRSKWYSLFDKEDRLEAFRGLWAVMAYLMRVTNTDSKPDSAADHADRP